MNGTMLASPADLVAAIPKLLGCEPADSIVMVGFSGRQLVCAPCGKLPPADPMLLEQVAGVYLARVLDRSASTVAILGYGTAIRVDPVVRYLHRAVTRSGLGVKAVLRVHQRRWWSCLCTDPACCPAEGTPYPVRGRRR